MSLLCFQELLVSLCSFLMFHVLLLVLRQILHLLLALKLPLLFVALHLRDVLVRHLLLCHFLCTSLEFPHLFLRVFLPYRGLMLCLYRVINQLVLQVLGLTLILLPLFLLSLILLLSGLIHSVHNLSCILVFLKVLLNQDVIQQLQFLKLLFLLLPLLCFLLPLLPFLPFLLS